MGVQRLDRQTNLLSLSKKQENDLGAMEALVTVNKGVLPGPQLLKFSSAVKGGQSKTDQTGEEHKVKALVCECAVLIIIPLYFFCASLIVSNRYPF